MKLTYKESELWSTKDFCHYVKRKLEKLNVNYEIKYPADLVSMKSVITRFEAVHKTRYAVKQFVDWVFENYDMKKIVSLNFLRPLVNDYLPKRIKSKPEKLKIFKDVFVDEKTKEWLKKLGGRVGGKT